MSSVTPRIAAPANLAAMAETMTIHGIARQCGLAHQTIRRMLKEAGIEAQSRVVPIPADFEERAASMTFNALAAHYGRGAQTVRRWASESGIKPCVTPKITARLCPAAPVNVDTSIAGRAATFLRHIYPSVYSCAVLPPEKRAKLPDRGVGRWVVGGKGALPAAEVVALAEAKGFDAHDWERI